MFHLEIPKCFITVYVMKLSNAIIQNSFIKTDSLVFVFICAISKIEVIFLVAFRN